MLQQYPLFLARPHRSLRHLSRVKHNERSTMSLLADVQYADSQRGCAWNWALRKKAANSKSHRKSAMEKNAHPKNWRAWSHVKSQCNSVTVSTRIWMNKWANVLACLSNEWRSWPAYQTNEQACLPIKRMNKQANKLACLSNNWTSWPAYQTIEQAS